MRKVLAGQVPMFSPDIWFGKTSPEHSAATGERISGPCWKKLAGLQNQPFLFLDMRGGHGLSAELLSETDGAWLGELMTRNIGECPRDAAESRLSQILEDNPPSKYSLSPRACQGILTRSERRGKTLPKIFRFALERQAGIEMTVTLDECVGGGGTD